MSVDYEYYIMSCVEGELWKMQFGYLSNVNRAIGIIKAVVSQCDDLSKVRIDPNGWAYSAGQELNYDTCSPPLIYSKTSFSSTL